MSKRIPVEISTTNKNLPKVQNEKGESVFQDITVKVDCEVPETLQEAAEFYGGEDKLMESVQGDVARRKSNAARPLLRDADKVLDWQTVAQQAVDQYQPGRRGGFAVPSLSEEELRGAGDMESLLALLRQKGVSIVSGGQEESQPEDETETVGAGAEG